MATVTPLKLGIVGCGNISPLYLKTFRHFAQLEPVALSDLDMDLARERAAEFGIGRVQEVDDLLNCPDIDVVVNLTVPRAHAEVATRALQAGKHVYNEKPLATELEEARALLELARQTNLRLACAPSTFLGATVQTARRALDDGLIGEPVAAHAAVLSHGMESWHPNPAFFYTPGAGPLFDLGPYWLSALVTLLGPVARVTGMARASFQERTVGSGPRAGESFPVTTPTHIAGTLQFAAGPLATLTTSFDVWHTELPKFEVYGSEGTLSLAAPNVFGGAVRVRGKSDEAWRELPLVSDYTTMEKGWGLALADLADAICEDRPHRASAEFALHLLETMHALLCAAETGEQVTIESECQRPTPLA